MLSPQHSNATLVHLAGIFTSLDALSGETHFEGGLCPRSRPCVVQEVCWLADGAPAHCPPSSPDHVVLGSRPLRLTRNGLKRSSGTHQCEQRRACRRLCGSERPFCACIRCPRQRPWTGRVLIPHGIAKLVILDLRAVISWNPHVP